MKTDRFDDLIKNKVDQIHFDHTDAEVNAVHSFVQTHLKNSYIDKFLKYKFSILYSILLLSLILNAWLWANQKNESQAFDFINKAHVNTSSPLKLKTILSTKDDNLLAAQIKASEINTEIQNQDKNFVQSNKNASQESQASGSADKISKPANLASSARRNRDEKSAAAPQQSLKNEETLMKYDVLYSVENKVKDDRSDGIDTKLRLLMQPLPTHAISLLYDYKEIPQCSLPIHAIEVEAIKPAAIATAKWQIGVNQEFNTSFYNIGLVAIYNLRPKISLVLTANRYIGIERHFRDKTDYENSRKQDLSEKYAHDFSDYNAVQNVNEKIKGYSFSIGANYRLPLRNNFGIIAGASSVFNLTSNAHLTFQYLKPPTLNFNQLGLNAHDYDFNFSHAVANLGMVKKLGRFDFNLVFNANFNGSVHHGHDSALEWSPGIGARVLYGL
jgi:hypothetical protein